MQFTWNSLLKLLSSIIYSTYLRKITQTLSNTYDLLSVFHLRKA